MPRKGYVAKNPTGPRGQAPVLTSEQLDDILKICREPYRTVLTICRYTACRVSEACCLTAENIRNGEIFFAETKTDKPRAVKVSPKLQAVLDASSLPLEGFLFPAKGGSKQGYISRQIVAREFKAAGEAYDIKCSTHSLRRSALTAMQDAGIPIKHIAAVSGHKSLNELSKYLEVSEANKQAAVNVL